MECLQALKRCVNVFGAICAIQLSMVRIPWPLHRIYLNSFIVIAIFAFKVAFYQTKKLLIEINCEHTVG